MKEGSGARRCAVLAIFWVVWMERNSWIFEGAKDEEVDPLLDIKFIFGPPIGNQYILSLGIILCM